MCQILDGYGVMNFFDHEDLGNHLLQLCPTVVIHPVYGPLVTTARPILRTRMEEIFPRYEQYHRIYLISKCVQMKGVVLAYWGLSGN
jgi:hypothetical protein